MSYAEFLASKRRVWTGAGIEAASLPSQLYPWQAAIVRWALRKGRAAVFADCGLGKTFMQVSWANALNVPTLFLAPLCVAEQTVEEAAKLGIELRYAESQDDVTGRLTITNYERLHKFDASAFQAVVLDESSILKAFDGQTRTRLIQMFADTKYRLCCTATPSPNDIAELGNHAEFLGLMSRVEFLATWFVKVDQGLRTTEHHGWRLKRHAMRPFFRWLASWAVALRTPGDLGYPDDGYRLPALTIDDVVLRVEAAPEGTLFHDLGMKGIQGRMAARRAALPDRVGAVVADVTRDVEQAIVWCGLNAEQDAIATALKTEGVTFHSVDGRTPIADKVRMVRAWQDGEVQILVTKPAVLGWGMNFQHCHRMVFVGLGDSFETYYQCIRRCWRFGQTQPVRVSIVVSESEIGIVQNVRRKEIAAADLSRELLAEMRVFEREELCA
jgi:hypothetical protein